MTAALAAALAVVVVVAVALAWDGRRRAASLRRERQRAEDAVSRQRDAVEAKRRADALSSEADIRALSAEERATAAEQRALDAEIRASEAEQAARPGAAEALLSLEQMRLEREWSDVVGPGVELPVLWDGTVASALGTELAVIRETMGAPGELGAEAEPAPDDPGRAILSMRVAVELLRLLARDGAEMRVSVGPDEITVEQETPGGAPAGLDRLAETAALGGAELSVAEGEAPAGKGPRLQVRLKLPGAR